MSPPKFCLVIWKLAGFWVAGGGLRVACQAAPAALTPQNPKFILKFYHDRRADDKSLFATLDKAPYNQSGCSILKHGRTQVCTDHQEMVL
jgi:hypothetical protein